MKEVIRKVYYCDYCRKRYFSKSIMTFHEEYCGKNPINSHICLKSDFAMGCDNLTVKTFVYENTNYTEHKEFYCNHFEKELYSYKAEAVKVKHEKKGSKIPNSINDSIKHGIRMPLECGSYKNEKGSDDQKIELIEEDDYGYQNWRIVPW